MHQLLKSIIKDYPELQFVAGNDFRWSPDDNNIVYDKVAHDQIGLWSLLHEVGHALLNHQKYRTDIELLMLEVAAWNKASQIAGKYKLVIDQEHVQNCLDTYRDWLHKRSRCPVCHTQSLQSSFMTYKCFNCRSTWQVSAARFCRPYRRRLKTKNP